VSTANCATDLRCGVRFPLRLPVIIRFEGCEFPAESRNISSAGALFRINESIPVGSAIEFIIAMPAGAIRAATDILVRCAGRVVRCSPVDDGHDLAAIIDEYHIQH
jgi:hypothetical protein